MSNEQEDLSDLIDTLYNFAMARGDKNTNKVDMKL